MPHWPLCDAFLNPEQMKIVTEAYRLACTSLGGAQTIPAHIKQRVAGYILDMAHGDKLNAEALAARAIELLRPSLE